MLACSFSDRYLTFVYAKVDSHECAKYRWQFLKFALHQAYSCLDHSYYINHNVVVHIEDQQNKKTIYDIHSHIPKVAIVIYHWKWRGYI